MRRFVAPQNTSREKLVEAAIVVQAEHKKIYELHLWAGSGFGSGSTATGIGTGPGLSNACCVIAAIYQLLAANLAFDIKTRALTINT